MIRGVPTPEHYGIFRGVDIKYPTYSVITPQTGLSFAVRSLNVSEVSRLKNSLSTPSKAFSLVNETIWDSIVSKPDFINTYNDFCKIITLKDREALLYGIHVMTFGYDRDAKMFCDQCGSENLIKYSLNKIFSINPYPKTEAIKNMYKVSKEVDKERDEFMERIIEEDIMKNVVVEDDSGKEEGTNGDSIDFSPEKKVIAKVSKEGSSYLDKDDIERKKSEFIKNSILSDEVSVTLPFSGLVCFVSQPTIKDEMDMADSLSFSNRKQLDLVGETLIIKRFEYFSEVHKEVVSITNRMDIFQQYQKLPFSDKKVIMNAFKNNFGDYGIELRLNWECKDCGSINESFIDLATMFFRLVVTEQ